MKRTHRLWNSLAARIVLPFAIALVLVFGLIAIYLGRTVQSEAVRELRDRGTLLSDTLAYNAELPLLARDTKALTALLEGAKRDPDLLRADVFDAKGVLVTSYVPPGRGASAGPTAGRTAGSTENPSGVRMSSEDAGLRLESPIQTLGSGAAEQESSAFALDNPSESAERTIGAVRLLISMDRTAGRTRHLQLGIGIAGVTLLLLCAGIGLGLVRVIGARLRALVEATRRVAAGDLSVRVSPSSADDIGELGEAFNRMAADLEIARAEVLAERADLERRVAQRSAQLERAQETLVQNEKMSAVGQLVAGVAHELNNPLTVILGYAGLMLETTTEAGPRRKLELLAGEAERSRKIVQNLLTFARKQKAERASVDVGEVITRTVGLRAYHLRSENIQIETDLDPGLPKTLADFSQLQQVILNLLVNAEQAIQDAGKGSRVTVGTRKRGERIEIVIEDDGPGIPAASRVKIFEPFFTTKPVGRGTGLGLSICYGIIVEHGGTIEVESEPGSFTRFIIALPIAGLDAALAAAPDAAVISAPQPGAQEPSRRLLVIDDDPGVLRFVVDAFAGLPVTIETALGGKEGIARLAAGQSYDLVISDMRMPDVDGRAVYRYVNECRPDLKERIVFTSGDIANPESLEFFERSGRPLLEKPFSVKTLRDAVSHIPDPALAHSGPTLPVRHRA